LMDDASFESRNLRCPYSYFITDHKIQVRGGSNNKDYQLISVLCVTDTINSGSEKLVTNPRWSIGCTKKEP